MDWLHLKFFCGCNLVANVMILRMRRGAVRQLHIRSLEFYDPAIADTKHLGE